MKVFTHNSRRDRTNSYLVGPDGPGDAVIIDPVELDVPLLNLIENNRYYLRAVLLTTPRPQTVEGLRTIKRVYDAEVLSSYPRIMEFTGKSLERRQKLNVSGLELEAIPLEPYSRFTLVFRIAHLFFSGTMLSAGLIAEDQPEIERLLIAEAFRQILAPLPDTMVVLPALGPPSTLAAERRFNHDLNTDPGAATGEPG